MGSKAYEAADRSCWPNLPAELLRDILLRIDQESECSRKNVVCCAGVCKSWRQIMKDIVAPLEISAKLTFPISLKQPGPRNCWIQCFIKRNRGMQSYKLYLNLSQAANDDGKFLLGARRCRGATYTDYIISLKPDDVSKRSNSYIGKLRSNFLGTKFTIYDAQPLNGGPKDGKSHSVRVVGTRQVSPKIVPARNYHVAHISYELNVLGSRGPRWMLCMMDSVPVSAMSPEGVPPTQAESIDSVSSFPLLSSRPESRTSEILVLKNKEPRWHEQLRCWCLNFNGRVTVASVKNFQLVENGDQEKVVLQFGKVGKDTFTMDYRYPMSAFQAFGICLSSFDTKIACE